MSIRGLIFFLSLLLSVSTGVSHSSDLQLSGNFVQGGLAFGATSPDHQVFLGDRKIQVTPDGRFIVGFGRDAEMNQTLTLITQNGRTTRHPFKVAQRNYPIERINGISKRMMKPSPDDLKRISREAQLVADVRASTRLREHFRDTFIWPVTGRISGVYGSQRFFNGEPRRPHYGIDIAAPTGTIVVAPAGGAVTLAHEGMFFSGATLIVDHGYGLSSSFLHLDHILVHKGDQVNKGQAIATVGASGRVTGPHLDWRINWFDQRLDPALLVPDMPIP